jgi:hypothetical protein
MFTGSWRWHADFAATWARVMFEFGIVKRGLSMPLAMAG